MTSLSATQALDRYFLEARSKLLDLAGFLDRIDRSAGSSEIAADLRMEKIRQALEVLHSPDAGRAERIQRLFSLDYDPQWKSGQ